MSDTNPTEVVRRIIHWGVDPGKSAECAEAIVAALREAGYLTEYRKIGHGKIANVSRDRPPGNRYWILLEGLCDDGAEYPVPVFVRQETEQ